MKSIREYFKGFCDLDGLVTPNPCDGTTVNGSGNGVLYTSLAVIGARLSNTLTLEATHEYEETMKRCLFPGETGLLKRGPHHPDQQAFDDYVGYVAGMAAVGNLAAIREVIRYGQGNYFNPWGPIRLNYFYNNVNPPRSHHPDGRLNFNAWLGRFPAFRGILKLSAQARTTLLERVGLSIGLIASAKAEVRNQDAWLMGMIIYLLCPQRPGLVLGAAMTYWRKRFNELQGGDVRAVVGRVVCPGHPVSLLYPERLV